MDGHGTEGWRGKEKKEREEREEQEGCHFYGRQKQLLCENYSVQLLCVFVCLWMGGGVWYRAEVRKRGQRQTWRHGDFSLVRCWQLDGWYGSAAFCGAALLLLSLCLCSVHSDIADWGQFLLTNTSWCFFSHTLQAHTGGAFSVTVQLSCVENMSNFKTQF